MTSSPLIELIREKLDIVDVVREYVPALKKAGRNYKANCPFHNEKTPSFTVNPDKQIYFCFGCSEGGDVFKFVMNIEGLTFPEAARKLALKAGVEYGDERTHAMTEADKERLELKKLLKAAAAFYHKELFSPGGEKAKLYLGERRLSKATVERFELGWAPAGGKALMNELKAKGWSRDLALKAGLITEREGGLVADTFRGRIMFPIRNQSGETVAFGGRVLDPEGIPKYLNSPETVLFSKRRTLYGIHEALPQIRKSGRLLLLEGYMDVIGAHQHGIDWAVAPLGTNLTVEHAGIVRRYAKDTVVMFDDDRAGVQASVKAANVFMESGLYVRLASIGGGLDPDEFLNEHGREEFEKKLDSAADPLDFQLNLLFKDPKNPPSSQDKAKAIGDLLETVARQNDEILKSEWIKSIAAHFGVDQSSALKELRKAALALPQEKTKPQADPARGIPQLEKDFLQLLLQYPALLDQSTGLDPEDFSHPMARKLFLALQALPAERRAKAAPLLAEQFPEDSALILGLAVTDFSSGTAPAPAAAQEIRKLRRKSLQRRVKELQSLQHMDPQQFQEYSRLMSELKSSAKDL
ncbi:MAG: DNA primase [Elusimicrobiales bacterium]|nr:DNA primase [Elusimicrobiales bacterium]